MSSSCRSHSFVLASSWVILSSIRARPPPIERRGDKAGALNSYLESAAQVMSERYLFEGDTAVIEPLVPALRWLLSPSAPVKLRRPVAPNGAWIPRVPACHWRCRDEVAFGFIPTHGATFGGAAEVGGAQLNAAGFNAGGGAPPGVELDVTAPGVAGSLDMERFGRAVAYLTTQLPDKA
eukprot:4227320-Amphidinium_carterae.1